MAIPDFQTVMLPLVKTWRRQERTMREVTDQLGRIVPADRAGEGRSSCPAGSRASSATGWPGPSHT